MLVLIVNVIAQNKNMLYFIEIGIANELTLLKNKNTEHCPDSRGTPFLKDQNY